MSIRRIIADAVGDKNNEIIPWHRPGPDDIREVEFNSYCDKILVTHYQDGEDTEYTTIPAHKVLDALLTWAMSAEVTHDD